MNSHKKLELSRETLRCLTSDLPSELLVDVQGGGNASADTCVSCLQCTTTIIQVGPTWINDTCSCVETR